MLEVDYVISWWLAKLP